MVARAWGDPWDREDTRPLVLVSFSTTRFWDQTSRIRNTLAGLADQPIRVLVSGAEPAAVGDLPANAVVRSFVPHGVVLPTVAATVTHCGHGTVTAALAHGVPLVGLPNPAADQPYLARRIEELGAGIALGGDADPAAIGGAVRAVLDRPAYRKAASVLAERIAAAPGVAGAATELEMRASRAAIVAR
jgi:MGT family glycosyltransferase